MDWVIKILIFLISSLFVIVLGLIGTLIYNSYQDNTEREQVVTDVGIARVQGCTHISSSSMPIYVGDIIIPMETPDSWWLKLGIGDKFDEVRATESECQMPIGSIVRVNYGYVEKTGRLVIKGFALQ